MTTIDLFAGPGGWDKGAESQQVGNAVPVRLARAILEAVAK